MLIDINDPNFPFSNRTQPNRVIAAMALARDYTGEVVISNTSDIFYDENNHKDVMDYVNDPILLKDLDLENGQVDKIIFCTLIINQHRVVEPKTEILWQRLLRKKIK